jgi:hypothetical protein
MASEGDITIPVAHSEEAVIPASRPSDDVEANNVLDFEPSHDDPAILSTKGMHQLPWHNPQQNNAQVAHSARQNSA